jgi:hypothetical protein
MKKINLSSAFRITGNTISDMPFALVGSAIGGVAVGMGLGVGILGSIGEVTAKITEIPELTSYAVKTGMYGLGTVGALFGAAAVNFGTARQAANMPRSHYRPTGQALDEREAAETISTVIGAVAAPASIYYFDLANKVLEHSLG